MNEIREDMLRVKRMVSEVEMIIGKREGETELVNKLIDAENLLTYCMSRLENAVVPPCKVGDTVYVFMWKRRAFYGKPRFWTTLIYTEQEMRNALHYGEIFIKEKQATKSDVQRLHRLVFLTREEAEKALAERQGKNEKP